MPQSQSPDRLARWPWWLALGLLGFLALTNHWNSRAPDMSVLRHDAVSYLEIARAAPRIPETIDVSPGYPELDPVQASRSYIPYQHAQRFVFPYLAGLIARALGADPLHVFAACVLVLFAATAWLLARTLPLLGASPSLAALLLAAYVCNPFVTRFYFVVPPYLGDVVFHFSLALLGYGLARQRAAGLISGAAIGILGRQTALLSLPGIWLFPARRRSLSGAKVLATIFVIAAYLITGRIALWMNPSSRNLDHIFGMWIWLSGESVEGIGRVETGFVAVIGALGAFLARATLSVLPYLAAILAAGRGLRNEIGSRESLAFALLAAGVASQPILAGPSLTGGTVVRLTALAAVPLVLLLGRIWRGVEFRPASLGAITLILAAASMHHRYSLLDSWSLREPLFIATFFVASGTLAFALRRARARVGIPLT